MLGHDTNLASPGGDGGDGGGGDGGDGGDGGGWEGEEEEVGSVVLGPEDAAALDALAPPLPDDSWVASIDEEAPARHPRALSTIYSEAGFPGDADLLSLSPEPGHARTSRPFLVMSSDWAR